MPGDLCTVPGIISLPPLSLDTDVTDATLGVSGLWLGTRTGAGGTAKLVWNFFGRSPHGSMDNRASQSNKLASSIAYPLNICSCWHKLSWVSLQVNQTYLTWAFMSPVWPWTARRGTRRPCHQTIRFNMLYKPGEHRPYCTLPPPTWIYHSIIILKAIICAFPTDILSLNN